MDYRLKLKITKIKNSILLIGGLSLSLFVSCSKQEEEIIPNPDSREIISGKWLCTEVEIGGIDPYTFQVTVWMMADTNNGLIMDNFALLNGEVLGVTSKN